MGQTDVAVFLPGKSEELVKALERYKLPCEVMPCSSFREVKERMRTATILVSTPVPASTFEAAHELKWIQSLSQGVEGWLNSAPKAVPITRMTGVFEIYMAEYVFAHLLSESQELPKLAEGQAHRSWDQVTTRSLSGLTLGVAGLGYVGAAVAKLAKAFDMHVLALGRTGTQRPEPGAIVDDYFDRSRILEFVARLDVLVLCLPATPETDGMFGLREFRAMRRGATVMNIGRGQAIDEIGLLRALREGYLGRAVIDTFRNEPLPIDSPIWDVPNMTITPHMAGAVYPDELARVVAPHIQAFLRGEIPEPLVDRSLGY